MLKISIYTQREPAWDLKPKKEGEKRKEKIKKKMGKYNMSDKINHWRIWYVKSGEKWEEQKYKK